VHLGWCRYYDAAVGLGGVSQSFDVRIERVPRFGAVKLSEFLLSLPGWLVLGLLVADGVVWQAPPRAARYTLIIASTEHEFSSGCCRVFGPDLPDAEKRRSAAAASSGRFLCRSKGIRRAPRRSATGWLWLNAGVAEYASTLHTCDPAVISGISSLMAVA